MSDVKNGKRLTYFSRRTLMDAVERARDEIERLCASDEYDQEGHRPCDLVPDFGTDDEGIQRDVDYTDPLTQAFYVWRYTPSATATSTSARTRRSSSARSPARSSAWSPLAAARASTTGPWTTP